MGQIPRSTERILVCIIKQPKFDCNFGVYGIREVNNFQRLTDVAVSIKF